jgi:hypothetical protein
VCFFPLWIARGKIDSEPEQQQQQQQQTIETKKANLCWDSSFTEFIAFAIFL